MAEIIERRDLVVRAIRSVIQVVAELIGGIEVNQIQCVFVSDRLDDAKKILMFLRLAALIAAPVHQPGDVCRWSKLLPELLDPQPAGPHKIHPPVIVRLSFEFFPLHQRRTSSDHDVLTLILSDRSRTQNEAGEQH
jgi:hypothetical protein